MEQLKLSICVVALNEEKFLPRLLENLRDQTYPHQLTEVVLVDSGSSDGTKAIMQALQRADNGFFSVQVLDNPKRVQAAGWNEAILHATGDVISRIDAHTMLPKEFSSLVMEEIENGEDVVGGIRPCLIENDTAWGKTLLATENSLFGSSMGSSRHSTQKQYVKTMFHASYRKEVFEKVGLFHEKLLRTEDNEMHYRIRKAGYLLCYDPRIRSYQYARSSLGRMIKQKFGNGYWIGLTLGVCPGCLSVYHLIPAAFVIGIFLTALLACLGYGWFSAALWGLYGLFCVVNTMLSIAKERILPHMLLMPFLFLSLHTAYGIGTILGVLEIPFKAKALRKQGMTEGQSGASKTEQR